MVNRFRSIGRIFEWKKFSIWEINKNCIDSLYFDENGQDGKRWIVNFYYFFIPALFSILLLLFGIFMSDEVSNYLITGVSIFAGLFFNLLLIIADKLKIRREVLNSVESEGKQNYLKRFEIFSTHFISTISYAIIKSIWLIILMLLCKIVVFQPDVDDDYILCYLLLALVYIFNFLAYYSAFKLVVLLFTIISSLYVMIFDDLNLNKGEHTY